MQITCVSVNLRIAGSRRYWSRAQCHSRGKRMNVMHIVWMVTMYGPMCMDSRVWCQGVLQKSPFQCPSSHLVSQNFYALKEQMFQVSSKKKSTNSPNDKNKCNDRIPNVFFFYLFWVKIFHMKTLCWASINDLLTWIFLQCVGFEFRL